jgi:hypothetical protein
MKHDPFSYTGPDITRSLIDRLQTLLNEAQGYFITNNHLAAWGTLVLFDEAAEDLKAAIRLYRSANSRRNP